MMSTIEVICPHCGKVLEPRVFSVDNAPATAGDTGKAGAFMVGMFLVCPGCGYFETFE